jgi:hypothetical protein
VIRDDPNLGFKTIILVISISTCHNLIILELRIFYNDNKKIKKIKILFLKTCPFCTSLQKFTLKLLKR